MSLIFITGNSGAGKSSVRRELQRRGYEAHDTDEDGITSWRHKTTDKPVIRPENENDRIKEWYEEHDWKMSRQGVEELANNAKNKLVFLCGSTSNDDEMLDLYGKVVYLTIDEDTLRNRLANRTDNDYGKAPDELSNILGWHKSFEDLYRDYGAVMIDATKPVDEVVDEILAQTHSLQSVVFQLPNFDKTFGDKLLSLLSPFGKQDNDTLRLTLSNPDFLPQIALELTGTTPKVVFNLLDETIGVEITNKTGQEKQSPETYRHISIDDFTSRLQDTDFIRLDHLGFNLPWLDGIHPDILSLRQELPEHCAYFRFPTGEDWDFILPATAEELTKKNIDLSKDRHPKLEIVSFDKCSTPLIQLDLSVRQPFAELAHLFPEGIADIKLRNVWVYLENHYSIDVCFVVGEHKDGDWSKFFGEHRL